MKTLNMYLFCSVFRPANDSGLARLPVNRAGKKTGDQSQCSLIFPSHSIEHCLPFMNTPEENESLRIVLGHWSDLQQDAMPVRFTVFVREQKVPEDIELDEFDAQSVHAVAYDQGRAIATGRLLPDGHIGRMAVLQEFRGTGVGSRLLKALIQHARTLDYPGVELSAQCHARAFYERHGFQAYGDVYLDAGIDHIAMRLVCVPED